MATSRSSSDSIKSTWRRWDRKYWHPGHWLLETLRLHHVDLDRTFPAHPKADMVPYAPEWQFHLWILIHAFVPLAIHQTYIHCFHHNISATAAYVLYSLSLKAIGIRQLHLLRRVGQKYGFFDGDKHERDGVPDVGVWKTFNSLLGAIAFRPMVATISTYRTDQGPSSIPWMWLPFKIAAYAVILDFWYYWYHRLMHEKAGLWKFHRTHHLTKHPNPLLSGYADTVQETFDIVVIPLMTFGSMNLLGLPISFYEWWVCQQYVIFTELLGHSGLRIEATAVNPMTWLLRMFDMELVIEDHDLHHRYGWRCSHNYGKQTRIWDRLFGTTVPRIEGYKGKIDYVNTAKTPLW